MKRSFQGWLSVVPMQPSFCEFATFTWRHLAHIVLFKVCHPDNTLNRTKSRVCGLQSHAKRPLCSSTIAFFRTMPAATSLCLSWKFPSILLRVDISQMSNPMMAFHTPSSFYMRIMYVKCCHWIRLLRGFVFGCYLMLSAVTFLFTKFDSELVYRTNTWCQ
jgi:hypothetical protein